MQSRAPRVLLGLSSAILLFGGAMHGVAYMLKAASAIGLSNLPPFLASELKVLWMADSTTLISVGATYAFLAVRPQAASGVVVLLITAVPAATTVLLYGFLGGFYAAHLLAAASVMGFAAGLLMRSPLGLNGVEARSAA
jgi:hypothetical protein